MGFQRYKKYSSPLYNYTFDRVTGKFVRWGKTKEDDPKYSIAGPEIADIEISTACSKGCAYCYKSNMKYGTYMTNDNYKRILNTINANDTLTQVALGIGDIDSNPELEKILITTRELGLVPNITINGTKMNDYYYDLLVKYCGAVSISRYNDEEMINVAKELKARSKNNKSSTLKNINIHAILCKDTYNSIFKFIKENFVECKLGYNLSDIFDAIVFLSLKPIGNRNIYTEGNDYQSDTKLDYSVSDEDYKKLIDYVLNYSVPIGFDSCGCYKFLNSIRDHEHYKYISTFAEPCESTLFSIYVNVNGNIYPCSFCEHSLKFINVMKKYTKSNNIPEVVNLLEEDMDFTNDVWYSEMFKVFRKIVLSTEQSNDIHCRTCPIFGVL